MEWLKSLLGIGKLEKEITLNKKKIKSLEKFHYKKSNNEENEVLQVLKGKMTTREISKKLNKSRSRISFILNQLEKNKKVKESGKKGREILYEKIK